MKEKLNENSLSILLVGGSHRLKGLKGAIERLGCKVLLWEYEVIGPVMGAALLFQKRYRATKLAPAPTKIPAVVPQKESKDHRQLRLAASQQLCEAATLVDVRGESKVTLPNGDKVVPGLGLTHQVEALREREKRLKNHHLRLAIVGPVNARKSTLINAILGERLLPVAGGPSTGSDYADRPRG